MISLPKIKSVKSQPLHDLPTIKERQAAVSFGRASAALEGFAVSSAAEAQQQRWVRGEISMEECIAGLKQAHQDE